MPTCTSVAKDERKTRGYRPGKDKLEVLLRSNGCGDFLIKPVLLHRFQNLCLLRRECEKHFSVYMMGGHKIWITEKLLDCFLKGSVPEVKQYLNQKKNLNSKCC